MESHTKSNLKPQSVVTEKVCEIVSKTSDVITKIKEELGDIKVMDGIMLEEEVEEQEACVDKDQHTHILGIETVVKKESDDEVEYKTESEFLYNEQEQRLMPDSSSDNFSLETSEDKQPRRKRLKYQHNSTTTNKPVNVESATEVIMDNEPSSDDDEDEDNDDDGDEDNEEPKLALAAAAAAVQPPKRKRRRKSEQVILLEETEKILGEWLEFEVPYLFDRGMPEHKDKVKIAAVMAEKAASLDPPITAKKLETWLSSIRTRFGRISREKIGHGAQRLTEREQWILQVFRFLKPHIVRQRKPRVLGFPKSASAAAAAQPTPANGRAPVEPEVVPVPQSTPPTAADARSEEEEEEDTTPAIEEPRRPKNARPAGGVGGSASTSATSSGGVVEKLMQDAAACRERLKGMMEVVEDPDMRYWRDSLDVMAEDCAPLKGVFRTQLKVEILSAITRFVVAQNQGVEAPGPDLMLHTYAGHRQPPTQTSGVLYPPSQPTASGAMMYPSQAQALFNPGQGATSQTQPSYNHAQPAPSQPQTTNISIQAQQVAALQGAFPQFMRPIGASTPVYRPAAVSTPDLSMQLPTNSFMDLLGNSQPATPATPKISNSRPSDSTLNTFNKP